MDSQSAWKRCTLQSRACQLSTYRRERNSLFIQPQKITAEVATYMKETGVNLHTYEEAEAYLSRISVESLLLNPAKTNYAMYSAVNPDCRIIHGASPVTLLKAIRNEQEIAGIHAAMQRDGVALVKFLKWLEASVPTGKETEISIDKNCMNFVRNRIYIWEKVSIRLPDTRNMEPSCTMKPLPKQMSS